jgi:hypothetical protein
VCEFGENRRVYNEVSKQMVDTPQYACEGGWLGGHPIGRQSVVRERIFKKPEEASKDVAEELKGKRHKKRESLAYQFAFQCRGVKALARRLRRESERPRGAATSLYLTHMELQRKHKKTVQPINKK